jgi:hypothetical protein
LPDRILKPVLIALLALNLLGWLSPAATDTDFWWHLRTGLQTLESKTLPVPDTFSYTSGLWPDSYPGESTTRFFNLTHEWLSQALLYGLFAIGGFPLVVFSRALILSATAALAGLLAGRRGGSSAWAVFGALACGLSLLSFTSDRPSILSFLFTAVFLCIFEFGLPLWLLPALALLWANSHGGFFLGWVVCGIYAGTAWLKRDPQWKTLAGWSAAAFLASGLNPNGWNIARILLSYRRSPMTSTLLEWQTPAPIGPPFVFQLLFVATVVALIVWRRQTRLRDWLLALAFGAAAWSAFRNIPLFMVTAPMLLAGIAPKRPLPKWAPLAAIAGLAVSLAAGAATGRVFQLRASEELQPKGAAAFLRQHSLPAPLLNTYADGGYLIWSLYPRYRTFIDGRSLNEHVFHDYRILFGATGPGAIEARRQTFQKYGIQTIVTEAYQTDGSLYPLLADLSDPNQTEWLLLFEDERALVFSRKAPAGVAPLPLSRVESHFENECSLLLRADSSTALCARSAGLYFFARGDAPRARKWLAEYASRVAGVDAVVQRALVSLPR